jgi:hypothetical protein
MVERKIIFAWIISVIFAVLIFGFLAISHSRVPIAERKTLTERQEAQQEKYINTSDLNETAEEMLINDAGAGLGLTIQFMGRLYLQLW